MESLEVEHELLAASARAAAEREEKAVADCAEAQARADSVERSSGARVQELEKKATQLRQQLETGANAAQARATEIDCEWGLGAVFQPLPTPPVPFHTDYCFARFGCLLMYRHSCV